MTHLTLSCIECGSDVDIIELRPSDTDAGSIVQLRCSACDKGGTVEVRYSDVELALEATITSRAQGTSVRSDPSAMPTSADTNNKIDSSTDSDSGHSSKIIGTNDNSTTVAHEANDVREISATESSTTQDSESQSGHNSGSEQESTSEIDKSVQTGDYETMINELHAVQKAGVKNLRNRSEVRRVANAIGHDTLIKFLQNADDAAYRTAVKRATESSE